VNRVVLEKVCPLAVIRERGAAGARDGFGVGSVAFGAVYAFVLSLPFVVVGVLVVRLALGLASFLRQRS